MSNRKRIAALVLALSLAISLAAWAEPAYYAILVGVNEYKDPTILPLSSPRNDAKAIADILGRSGWDLVAAMTDDQDIRSKERLFPDKDNIEHRVSLLADMMSPEDVAFIFFSGHGVRSERGEALLLPFDANRERLTESSVSVEWIKERFRAKGLRKVFFALDACRENLSSAKGLAVVGVAAGQASAAATKLDYPILYSTQDGGFSYETMDGPEARSLFARFLAEGLKAPASDPERRDLDWASLCESVRREAGRYALEKGVNQKPDFYLPPGAPAGTVVVRADRAAEASYDDLVFGGVGMGIWKDLGGIRVGSVYPLGPADLAGVLRGDCIVSVNGMDASAYTVDQFAGKVRGLAGTQVRLKILREKDRSIVDLAITRSTITQQTLVLQEEGPGRPRVAVIVQQPLVQSYDIAAELWIPTSFVSKKAVAYLAYNYQLIWPLCPGRSVLADFEMIERSPGGKLRRLKSTAGTHTFEDNEQLAFEFQFAAGEVATFAPGEYGLEVLYKGRPLASTKYWIGD